MKKFGISLVVIVLVGCPNSKLRVHCTTDSDCVRGSKMGICVPNENACAFSDTSCASGYRYDTTAANGAGDCVAFPAGTDLSVPDDMTMTSSGPDMAQPPQCVHDSDCTNGGAAPCGGTCAMGKCSYPGPTVDCGSSCTANVQTAKVCDGHGSCSTSMLNCGVYQCGATTCKNSCTNAATDCNATPCTNGVCVACPNDMVYIPPGSFSMGYNGGASDPHDHLVTVTLTKGYCIDKNEVTVAQYKACVTAGVCTEANDPMNYFPTDCTYKISGGDNLPINCVAWSQANTYCTWAGLSGGARRLPTEAQWERAARGTDARTYPWGNTAPDCTYANYAGVGNPPSMTNCNLTSPYAVLIGSFPKGVAASGINDAAGNVAEWNADCYVIDYTNGSPCSAGQTCIDPPANTTGCYTQGGVTYYTVRGGYFGSPPSSIATNSRNSSSGGIYYDREVGFRCAK